jgi:3',5'-cyclic AMP phosphodiesterase CpdA
MGQYELQRNSGRGPMLIAQVTDIHVGFDRASNPEEFNQQRLRAVLERLTQGPNRPDLLIASGDLTDSGDCESSARVAELLLACPFPVYPMVGNHDSREETLAAFPGTPSEDGFIHYALERDGLRILLLDTFEPGRHGGAFCEGRKAWLAAELAAHPQTPTLILMHHPPIVSGIKWMDPAPNAGWVRRFSEAVRGRSQIVAIHCGHLHRPLLTSFAGIPLAVAPSVAPLVAMDFNPIDPDYPDGRALITTEQPGYALHRWDGASLVTHYGYAGDWRAAASYDQALQPMIRAMLAEHAER